MKHRDLTDLILKVFFEVYNEQAFGYLESVYERAMAIALQQVGLQVRRQVPITVYVRGNVVGEFIADLLVDDRVLLELTAARAIDSAHEAQTLNYLRATPIEVALLVNFGPRPEFRRFVFENSRKRLNPTTGEAAPPNSLP